MSQAVRLIRVFDCITLNNKGKKFPAPTDGSKIETVSERKFGNRFKISVTKRLSVKKASCSCLLEFDNSTIRLRLA